jgi:hypothetical protein
MIVKLNDNPSNITTEFILYCTDLKYATDNEMKFYDGAFEWDSNFVGQVSRNPSNDFLNWTNAFHVNVTHETRNMASSSPDGGRHYDSHIYRVSLYLQNTTTTDGTMTDNEQLLINMVNNNGATEAITYTFTFMKYGQYINVPVVLTPKRYYMFLQDSFYWHII